MSKPTMRAEGFREASKQLNNMRRATAQGVGRRALPAPATILRDEMKARVARLTGTLHDKIEVQKARAKRGRPQITVIADDVAAMQNEFGNSNMDAQPFARPALEAKKGPMFDAFATALREEVDKSVIRANRRAARKAARTGG